jgi:hypothetical protein
MSSTSVAPPARRLLERVEWTVSVALVAAAVAAVRLGSRLASR